VLDEEDLEVAALHACHLEATKANLEALQSILSASLSKAEPEPDEKPVEIKEVVPVTEDAIPFAEGVIRAGKNGTIFTV